MDLLFLDINLNYILLYLQVLTNYLFLFLFFSSRFDTTRCLSHSFSNNIKSGQICLFANRSSLHIILCSSCAKRRISFPCRRHHFNSYHIPIIISDFSTSYILRKIFIFDDSFSALDLKTDAALRKALAENVKDSTVIIVAQRISTILHAEQILVLDDGKIVGKGTHEELLKSCEVYQQIAKSQLSAKELGLEESEVALNE